MALSQRPLGKQGLVSSSQGLGCMGMSGNYGTPSQEEDALAVIHRALELGVTHLDTSDVYGPFTNERLVGKAIKGNREKYVIATKVGIIRKDGQITYDGSRKHVREAAEASLKRLGIDTIDLYYLHRVDPNTPVEETFAEFKALQAEGKVRHVGISEASPEDIRKAHAVTPLTAVQLEWSLWSRDVEEDIIPVLRELGIGIVAYSPLGRGFLTGAIKSRADLEADDNRLNNPRFAEGNFEQGDDVFPIPGTRSIQRLEENVAAAHLELSKADLAELEAAVPTTHVKGDRNPNLRTNSYHYYKYKNAATSA